MSNYIMCATHNKRYKKKKDTVRIYMGPIIEQRRGETDDERERE